MHSSWTPRQTVDLEERFSESYLFCPSQFRDERISAAPPAQLRRDEELLDLSDLRPQPPEGATALVPTRKPSERAAAGQTAGRMAPDLHISDHPLASFRTASSAGPPAKRYELIYRNYAPTGPPAEIGGTPVPLPAHAVLLRVALFDKKMKRQEWIVHGKQTLLELRNVLDCLTSTELKFQGDMITKFSATELQLPSTSALFYIEGGFYTSGPADLSVGPRDWLEARGEAPQQPQRMEEVTFEMLRLRLGKQYCFLHHGSCEHTIVFTACWLATPIDEQDSRLYPKLDFQRKLAPKMCSVCHQERADWECHGDTLADSWPSYLCETCHYQFHYTTDGQLLRDDYAEWPYLS